MSATLSGAIKSTFDASFEKMMRSAGFAENGLSFSLFDQLQGNANAATVLDGVTAGNPGPLSLLGLAVASGVAVVLDNSITTLTTGKIVSFRNNGVEKMFVPAAGGLTEAAATLALVGKMADGASAVGVSLNSGIALVTGGAKLVSVQNNAVEKAFFDLNGLL